MSKVKNYGYTDTSHGGDTTSLVRGNLNFVTDWRVKSNTPGKEVVLTNITSPVDRPEKIRLAYSEVANVYSGTEIEPSLMAPTKRGVSILAQLTNVMSVRESDPGSDFRVDLPISAHLVIKVPASAILRIVNP